MQKSILRNLHDKYVNEEVEFQELQDRLVSKFQQNQPNNVNPNSFRFPITPKLLVGLLKDNN